MTSGTIAIARSSIGDDTCAHSASDGHVQQSPLFFDAAHRVHAHRRGEQLFLDSDDDDVLEFQTLGSMNGHQCHAVAVVLIGVLVGEQRNLGQIVAEQILRVARL